MLPKGMELDNTYLLTIGKWVTGIYFQRRKQCINNCIRNVAIVNDQSGRSPNAVPLFSATNFSIFIIELGQLHDTIEIK